MKTYTEETRKSTPFLQKAANYMKKKLCKASIWRFTAYTDGHIGQTPSSTRGNASYAYFQSFRVDEIQQKLHEKLLTNGKDLSDMLFMTHTLKYEKDNPEDIERVWKEGHKAIPKMLRSMRKVGMVDYCVAIEAFEEAGFHIHLAVVLDHAVGMKKYVKIIKGKRKVTYRLTDRGLTSFIRTAWAKAAGKDLEEAHSDIQACYSSELAGYIMKELRKASCVEKSLKRYQKGEDTEADRKKIQAFYMADKLKIRLFRVSRGLSSAQGEPDERLPQEVDLITNSNNSTKAKSLFSIVLTKSQLFRLVDLKKFEPFTGNIDRDTETYEKIRGIFDERFSFSEIVNDKERLERLLEEKEKQKKKEIEILHLVRDALKDTA